MDDQQPADISKLFSDQVREDRPPAKKPKSGKGGKPPKKKRQPRADAEASLFGQRWYDHGVAEGFEFPYDANYFALALEKKVSGDAELQKVAGDDRLERWVTKMVDLWWGRVDEHGRGGYLTNEITARNAKEYFLVTDWDDLRDYARSCLRAAYLKEHGRPVTPDIDWQRDQAYQDRLRQTQKDARVKAFVETVDLDAEPPKVDEEGRARLRSWLERKRSEKK